MPILEHWNELSAIPMYILFCIFLVIFIYTTKYDGEKYFSTAPKLFIVTTAIEAIAMFLEWVFFANLYLAKTNKEFFSLAQLIVTIFTGTLLIISRLMSTKIENKHDEDIRKKFEQ